MLGERPLGAVRRSGVLRTGRPISWAGVGVSARPEGFAISADGLRILAADPEQRRQFVQCALSFREFVRVWKFLDQENGVVRVLGDVLWPAQETYIATAEQHAYLTCLKSRQVGETTAAIAHLVAGVFERRKHAPSRRRS